VPKETERSGRWPVQAMALSGTQCITATIIPLTHHHSGHHSDQHARGHYNLLSHPNSGLLNNKKKATIGHNAASFTLLQSGSTLDVKAYLDDHHILYFKADLWIRHPK